MDKSQKIILALLILISATSWVASKDQAMIQEMMLDSETLLLFTATWTVGMAAMMFPSISPMVLLYKKLIKNNTGQSETGAFDNVKLISFVSSYLVVWAITGIVMLVGWSTLSGNFFMEATNEEMAIIYGVILIISGTYQFSPLKTKCLGYCESPTTFFMRRWKSGSAGAVKMGTFHGLYCLGCCWPYFLLMIALGWMNLVFMGLFAVIIFGEKIWSKGIWVSRMVGIGFIVFGLISMLAPDQNILLLNSDMM